MTAGTRRALEKLELELMGRILGLSFAKRDVEYQRDAISTLLAKYDLTAIEANPFEYCRLGGQLEAMATIINGHDYSIAHWQWDLENTRTRLREGR